MNTEVIITHHAAKRLRKRNNIPKKSLLRTASIAYQHGLKRNHTAGKIRQWMDDYYFRSECRRDLRLYGDSLYIFDQNVLVTVLKVPGSLQSYWSREKNKRTSYAAAAI